MRVFIYLIIFILFGVLIFWTWNNTKDYETNTQKIRFIAIGLMFLYIISLVIFKISKIGVNYPSKEIVTQVQKMAMFVFVPINGFLSLPHIASIMSAIKLKTQEEDKIKRKIIVWGIIIIVTIFIEIIYLKQFQNGIIILLNSKK